MTLRTVSFEVDTIKLFDTLQKMPVTPGDGHGFDYPKERRKLRLCRGYLNSIVGPRLNELARKQLIEESEAPAEKWIDPL